MDITVTTNSIANNKSSITTGTIMTDTPRRIQSAKIIPFINGALKHENGLVGGGVRYTECLKNHAASLGSHALDGCGEFMPAATAIASDPTSLKCAACGCHRNFHRQEQQQQRVIEYHPQHRHQPLPARGVEPHALAACQVRSPGSDEESPPPISSTYYPVSAPHTLHGAINPLRIQVQIPSRKRFRTKFSQDQKDKMEEFAGKIEWKMVKSNEDLINQFCTEIGVKRGVFKVWMHNNKSTIGKVPRSESTNYMISANQGGITAKIMNNNNNINNNNNNNAMEVDEEHVNGNNSHSSSINNSHTISLHQHSNASSSSS